MERFEQFVGFFEREKNIYSQADRARHLIRNKSEILLMKGCETNFDGKMCVYNNKRGESYYESFIIT